jgi:hypothetical protein
MLGDRARADVELACDRPVGAAARSKLQNLCFAVGQVGECAGIRRQGRSCTAPIAHPPQPVVQRFLDRAEDRAVVVAEVAPGPAQRERGDQAVVRGGRHAERNLVINRNMSEILRVNVQPVELLPGDKVAYLGGPAGTGGAVMNEQGMLVQVGLENRYSSRVKAVVGKIGVTTQTVRIEADFLVSDDIASH